MAQDYSEYLAVHVVNERQPVSFRSVSRALKVHANLAKQILFDFHHRQNSKKPGSIHATYLITGTKTQQQINGAQSQDGEDSTMQSAPIYPSSSMPGRDETTTNAAPVKSIMLAKEEHLEQAKAAFDHIIGMHIYSLQATGLSDMQTLTECNRSIAASYASEDPLETWKQYGTIQNVHVKRRTGKVIPRPPQPTQPKNTSDAKSKPAAAATKGQAPTKQASQEGKPEAPKTTASKPSGFKREESNLFKSFAKASAKPKKPVKSDTSAAPTPDTGSQDVSMTGFSDDDDENNETDSALPEELQDIKVPGGKSRKEREAELEAMMDQEDEPMADADTGDDAGGEEAGEDVDSEKEDDKDVGAIDGAGDGAANKPTEQESVTVENGRRRGRRRVMKKRTVKDEEGYLVTKEEAAWESFSEEEPAPKKPKVEVAAPGGSAGGKKPAKAGQGNIMSFFSKK